MNIEAPSRAFLGFLEELSRDRVEELGKYCRQDVRFKDPFNDVVGLSAYQAALTRMFDNMTGVTLEVRRFAYSEDNVCFAEWRFTYRPRDSEIWFPINGISAIEFDENGLVAVHRAFWDAASQIYERQPIIGSVFRAMRRRMATA